MRDHSISKHRRRRWRFRTWPNFGIESFLLARRNDRIAGCLAPYDADPFKRTRVLGYYDRMRWIRLAFDAGAMLLRYPALPRPGETFRFRFLSHLEIDGDDPAILHDLVRAAYREHAQDNLHFLSAMIPRGSPLERAFRGFAINRTEMTVYAVTLPGGRFADRSFSTMHPGFEMTLS